MFFFSAFAAILFLFGSSQKTSLGVNALAIPNPRYSLSTEATIGSGHIMERQLNEPDQKGVIAAIVPRAPLPPSTLTQSQAGRNQAGRKKYHESEGPDEPEQSERLDLEDLENLEAPEELEEDHPHEPPDTPCGKKNITKEEEIRCKKQQSRPSA